MNVLDFLPANYTKNFSVLLIESEEILPEIKKLVPRGQINFIENYNLPVEPKIFDVVIAREIFTYAADFYRKLLEINHTLKDSGYLLTEFKNVRSVEILEKLRRGEFTTTEQRFFAKSDVVKILDDAIYKEIRFLPGERVEKNILAWEKFGFENFNEDLITRNWIVKARKCTAEVAALKEIYTEEIRAELARILHRIEYDIETEKNLIALKNLCEREKIFYDYLSDFIDQTVIHEKSARFIKKIFSE